MITNFNCFFLYTNFENAKPQLPSKSNFHILAAHFLDNKIAPLKVADIKNLKVQNSNLNLKLIDKHYDEIIIIYSCEYQREI